jgi:hypothetical protein
MRTVYELMHRFCGQGDASGRKSGGGSECKVLHTLEQDRRLERMSEHEEINIAAAEAEAAAPQPEAGEPGALGEAELNEMIEALCNSKAEEFRMLGYEQVTGREVWECVSSKYEKKGYPHLHQIVNDILSLKSTQFMNWMTMSIYKKAQF